MKTSLKNPQTVTVAITETDIVKNNPNRVQLTIVNNGTSEIHIDTMHGITTSTGIRIAPSGTVTFNKMEDGELVNHSWVGIATGAQSNCRVYEVVKEEDN
jgi:hypothetical protein